MTLRRPASCWLGVVPLLVVSLGSFETVARAESPSDACFSAPLDGQKLRKAGHLLEARERFAACSRKKCPAKIVAACVRWNEEVAAAMPSVVLAARDGAGKDVTDARVSIDGSPATELSPLAIPLDPGTHRFAFERAGSVTERVTERVVLHEAEKQREVRAVFPSAPARDAAPVAAAASTPPTETPPDAEPGDDASPAAPPRPVPPSVWVLTGAGGLALASFATFAALGLTARSSDHCASGCSASQYDTVMTELRVGDASLGVGLVALGTAFVLYLTRPTATRTVGSWVSRQPLRWRRNGEGRGLILVTRSRN